MFLSKLVVDVGDRSDRFRPGRRWIQQPYRVHQRLCMAFPNDAGRMDHEFLKSFDPANFFDFSGTAPEWDASRAKAVHVERDEKHGFLFRIDLDSTQQSFIIVQSAREPDWDYAFHNAGSLIKAHAKKPYDPTFQRGQLLRFRLRAHPTKRESLPPSQWRDLLPGDQRKKGRRIALCDEEKQAEWLNRQASNNGYRLHQVSVQPEGSVRAVKPEHQLWFHAVLFEGLLEVMEPEKVKQSLARGVGPGKAFGFGLLSVAAAHG
jgi:CRISPR system Cascade subunit CasE